MDRGSRRLGMIVFLLGIALLIAVFVMAYRVFATPISTLICGAGGSASATASQLGTAVVATLIRIGLLFVMTLAGSLIASRGISLYLGPAAIREPSESKPTETS